MEIAHTGSSGQNRRLWLRLRLRDTGTTDQPEMTRDRPLTDDAVIGAPSVIENAPAATVMLAAFVVPRFVVAFLSDTAADFALHAALTAVKFTPVTWYVWAVAL